MSLQTKRILWVQQIMSAGLSSLDFFEFHFLGIDIYHVFAEGNEEALSACTRGIDAIVYQCDAGGLLDEFMDLLSKASITVPVFAWYTGFDVPISAIKVLGKNEVPVAREIAPLKKALRTALRLPDLVLV